MKKTIFLVAIIAAFSCNEKKNGIKEIKLKKVPASYVMNGEPMSAWLYRQLDTIPVKDSNTGKYNAVYETRFGVSRLMNLTDSTGKPKKDSTGRQLVSEAIIEIKKDSVLWWYNIDLDSLFKTKLQNIKK